MGDENGVARSIPRLRTVLFICAANTARSVMAEHLLRIELQRRGVGGRIVVRSAGIAPYARDGSMVSLDTKLVLRELGVHLGEEAISTDLKRHPELLDQADVIIAMTAAQVAELFERFPAARSRPIFTLRGFVGEAGDIEDPYEQGEEIFAACRDEIKRLIDALADRLLEE